MLNPSKQKVQQILFTSYLTENTLCGQSAGFLNVKAGGKCSYHRTFEKTTMNFDKAKGNPHFSVSEYHTVPETLLLTAQRSFYNNVVH
jgi:hypothetical protein